MNNIFHNPIHRVMPRRVTQPTHTLKKYDPKVWYMMPFENYSTKRQWFVRVWDF